ncbi:hypothetical protein GZL_06277 [Streptomyces sp. 769]|nr:hypothetical protein GZL_06277 [Streptomyces sp. 769]
MILAFVIMNTLSRGGTSLSSSVGEPGRRRAGPLAAGEVLTTGIHPTPSRGAG